MLGTHTLSSRSRQFSTLIFEEIAGLAHEYGALDLALGTPDFPVADEVKEAAIEAIRGNLNQYAILYGAKSLREAIATTFQRDRSVVVDPESEITVTCGVTEAVLDALFTVTDPGDEVVVFEPYYENYVSAIVLSGAVPCFVPLHAPTWLFNREELAAAFTSKTRALILNNPNNPTGKVFSREDLRYIGELCAQHRVTCIADEIYEVMVYDDAQHISMVEFDDLRDYVIVVNGLSKTFGVTGWRVGYVVAPPEVTRALRKIHSIVTAGTAAPLQAAGVTALLLPPSYRDEVRLTYQQRRDSLTNVLQEVGFVCKRPQGTFYVMAGIERFGSGNDIAFTKHLITEVGVAAIPGSSFYAAGNGSTLMVRFCFGKSEGLLAAAAARLRALQT